MTVDRLMSRDVITVEAHYRPEEAERIAAEHGVRHLPVLASGQLVGMLCLCDLEHAAGDSPVASYMSAPVVSIRAGADLATACGLMASRRLGCLPVVRAGLLVGIVTRGDLLRAGVATAEELGAARCLACGGHQAVQPLGGVEGFVFCGDCRARARARAAYLDEGAGD